MIVLVTGGSGSGKSAYAERLTEALSQDSADRRVYIATMRVWDGESERRVARHRAQRAALCFETIECPVDIAQVVLPENAVVLLEDIPNLVANEIFEPDGDANRILPGLAMLAERCRHLVIVTNDIFSDGGAYEPTTRAYMRLLAQVNQSLASLADCGIEVVYTIPVPFKRVKPCPSAENPHPSKEKK